MTQMPSKLASYTSKNNGKSSIYKEGGVQKQRLFEMKKGGVKKGGEGN